MAATLAAFVVAIAVFLMGGPGRAGAAPATTVAANSVQSLADPGTTLAVPVDGRLRGYRFAGAVTGVATGDRLDQPGGALAAGPGQQLWDFGLQWTASTDSQGDVQTVTATLVVDGTRITIPTPSDTTGSGAAQSGSGVDTGPTYWLASVPAAAADVAVELASAGFAQTFSLTRMQREGAQPAALYRDPTSWQTVQPESAEHDISTPDPDGYVPNAVLPVTLSGVTLSYFGPDRPTDLAADAGHAWLIPQLNSLTLENSGNGMCYPPLPGTDLTLTIAGQAPVTAVSFPGLGTDRLGFGAFTDGYAFQVPANVTTATLSVTPGTMQAQTGNCATAVTVTAAGAATFPLTLPAPTYQPPAGAATRPTPIRTLTATSHTATNHTAAAPTRAAGGGSFPTLAVVLPLIALALAGGAITVRRRRPSSRSPEPPPQPASPSPTRSEPGAQTAPPAPVPAEPSAVRPPGEQPPADRAASDQPQKSGVSDPVDMPSDPAATPAPAQTAGTAAPTAVGRPAPVPPRPRPSLLPGFDPTLPFDPGGPGVGVLGDVVPVGWPPMEAPLSQPVLELAAYLVLHSGKRPNTDVLRQALASNPDRPLSPDTARTYAGTLRRIFGVDQMPEGGRTGYALLGVTSDWHRYIELTRSDDPFSWAEALRLIRGQPFADVYPEHYTWAAEIISQIEVAVTDTATRLAERAVDAGDADLAAWAARQGLLVVRQSETLNSLDVRAAARSSNPDALDQTWRDVTRRYLPDPPPLSLVDLYRTLRESRDDHP